jgi:hypothetical protein
MPPREQNTKKLKNSNGRGIKKANWPRKNGSWKNRHFNARRNTKICWQLPRKTLFN